MSPFHSIWRKIDSLSRKNGLLFVFVLFLGPIVFFTSQRHFQYLCILPILIWVLAEKKDQSLWICNLGLVLFLATAISHWFGLELNGFDFSIFDYMLYNTWNTDSFMYTPLYDVNHLGIHQSYILFLLVPFYSFVTNGLFLCITHAVIMWSAVLFLRRLTDDMLMRNALCLCYLASATIGSTLKSGFRIEGFYPLAIFGLLFSIQNARSSSATKWIGMWSVVLLSIKEDAALYLGALCIGLRLQKPFLAVGALSFITFIANIFLVRPFFLEDGRPGFMSFWSPFGLSLSEILWTFLTQPVSTLMIILKSGWPSLYLPFFLLPLFHIPTLMASLPGILMLGTATGSKTMYEYGAYYPIVLLCLALYGIINVRAPRNLKIVLLCIFPLFHNGSIRIPWPKPELYKELRSFPSQNYSTLQVQAALFPYVPYSSSLKEAQGPGLRLVSEHLKPYPYPDFNALTQGCTLQESFNHLSVYLCAK